MLSFADYSDGYHSENASTSTQVSTNAKPTIAVPIRKPERAEPIVLAAAVPPPPPPKPKKTGAEKIADMQTGELNDILITEEGAIDDYAEYCSNLLEVTSFTQFSANGWLK